eukprot:SM000015S01239  [mRNA]  locus=s15:765823:766476:+ [translate_table: standard]
MVKVPVRVKCVVDTLSPFELKVMSGLYRNLSHDVATKVKNNFVSWCFCAVPVVGTVGYANYYREQEKLHERY